MREPEEERQEFDPLVYDFLPVEPKDRKRLELDFVLDANQHRWITIFDRVLQVQDC